MAKAKVASTKAKMKAQPKWAGAPYIEDVKSAISNILYLEATCDKLEKRLGDTPAVQKVKSGLTDLVNTSPVYAAAFDLLRWMANNSVVDAGDLTNAEEPADDAFDKAVGEIESRIAANQATLDWILRKNPDQQQKVSQYIEVIRSIAREYSPSLLRLGRDAVGVIKLTVSVGTAESDRTALGVLNEELVRTFRNKAKVAMSGNTFTITVRTRTAPAKKAPVKKAAAKAKKPAAKKAAPAKKAPVKKTVTKSKKPAAKKAASKKVVQMTPKATPAPSPENGGGTQE